MLLKFIVFLLSIQFVQSLNRQQWPLRSQFATQEEFDQAMDDYQDYEDHLDPNDWLNENLEGDPLSPFPESFPFFSNGQKPEQQLSNEDLPHASWPSSPKLKKPDPDSDAQKFVPRPKNLKNKPHSRNTFQFQSVRTSSSARDPTEHPLASKSETPLPKSVKPSKSKHGKSKAKRVKSKAKRVKSNANRGAWEQEEIEDVPLKISDRKIASLLTSQNNSRIVMGRFMVFSPDQTRPRCLVSVGSYNRSRPHLDQAPCGYNLNFIFIYDKIKRILRSARHPDLHLTLDYQISDSMETANRLLFVKPVEIIKRQRKEARFGGRVIVTLGSFFAIKIHNPHFPEMYCLRAPDSDRSIRVEAVQFTKGDSSACSLYRMIPLQDDFSTGRILVKKGNKQMCVTHTGRANTLKSVLSIADCDPEGRRQLFLYNDMNGQLRALRQSKITDLSENPAIFMWWSGPMRFYSSLPLTGDESNYGWTMPNPRFYGPILSRDTRGYSGNCWMAQKDGQIVANQTCTSFKFDPIKMSPSLELRDSLRGHYTVGAMIQIRTDDGLKCLEITRQMRGMSNNESDKDKKISVFWLNFEKCDVRRSKQRFVISSGDAGCLYHTVCGGHLRWAGDPVNTFLWPTANINLETGRDGEYIDTAIRPQTRFTTPHLWLMPIREFGRLSVSYNARSCWKYDSDRRVVFLSDMKKNNTCADVRVIPIRDLYDMPSDLVVVQEFRGSMTVHMALDRNKKYQKTSTAYFLDSGFFGMRRLAQPRGGDFEYQGDLFLTQGRSIAFPFKSRHFSAYPTSLVTIRFAAPAAIRVEVDRGHALMLFTFQAQHGCLVYLTVDGHVGLRCRTSRGERQCQLRFVNSFSLVSGALHTLSVLFSRSRWYPTVLYVDQQEVGRCVFPDWSIYKSSDRVKLFNDGSNWRYQAFAGRVSRFSVLVGSFRSLVRVATGKVLAFPTNARLDPQFQLPFKNNGMDSLGYAHDDSDEAFSEESDHSNSGARRNRGESRSKQSHLEQQSRLHSARHARRHGMSPQKSCVCSPRAKFVKLPTQVNRCRCLPRVQPRKKPIKKKRILIPARVRNLAILTRQGTQSQNIDVEQQMRTERERLDQIKVEQQVRASDDDLALLLKKKTNGVKLFETTRVPPLTTVWRNCRPLNTTIGNHTFQSAIRCELAVLNDLPFDVTQDIFTLGCSRPLCEIFFSENQPSDMAEQRQFLFEYHPHYPQAFNSENVGTPPLFPDQAEITDGFSTGVITFDVLYRNEPVPLRKIQSHLEINSQVGVSDVCQYRMYESTLGPIRRLFISIIDDMF